MGKTVGPWPKPEQQSQVKFHTVSSLFSLWPISYENHLPGDLGSCLDGLIQLQVGQQGSPGLPMTVA